MAKNKITQMWAGRGLKPAYCCLPLCLLVQGVFAQTLLMGGEVRPRTEFRDGYGKPLEAENAVGVFTCQRTRLNISYKSVDFDAMIVLQDARIFGQEPHNSNMASVGINQAWANVPLFAGAGFKIGRQAISFDDNRLFSSPAWSNTGNSHDMALLHYGRKAWKVQVGAAYNNRRAIQFEELYVAGAAYRWMGIVHVSKNLWDGLLLSAIVVDEGVQDTLGIGLNYKKLKMNHCFTFGGNLKYETSGLPISALATAYFQQGKSNNGLLMNGKLLALKLNYAFSGAMQASLGVDFLSGDDDGDAKVSNFRKLYGADHTFNGYMDYWSVPNAKGLVNYYASIQAQISKKLRLELSYHYFDTDKYLSNKAGLMGKHLGSEVDVLLSYKKSKYLELQGGYCRYFANDYTLLAKGMAANTHIRNQQWLYVMLTLKMETLKIAGRTLAGD